MMINIMKKKKKKKKRKNRIIKISQYFRFKTITYLYCFTIILKEINYGRSRTISFILAW